MFHKLVNVLKKVFWIKPSRKKPKTKTSRRKIVRKSSVKKKIAKKTPKLSVKPKRAEVQPKAKSVIKTIDPALQQVGIITHYFKRIKVCVVKLTQGTVLIGDKLNILGVKTKFVQKVWSMQIESKDVKIAQKGQLIGLKVDKDVVVGDKVYK